MKEMFEVLRMCHIFILNGGSVSADHFPYSAETELFKLVEELPLLHSVTYQTLHCFLLFQLELKPHTQCSCPLLASNE